MNFREFDEIIHSGVSEVVLDSDVILDGKKIYLDVDGIIIDGAGHMIDATSKSGIFYCKSKDVTVKNIIFKNGNAISGSAITNFGSGMTVENCKFISNKARNEGSAIYNCGKMVLEDVSFKDNSYSFFHDDLVEDVFNAEDLILKGKISSDNPKSILNRGCVCTSLENLSIVYNKYSWADLNVSCDSFKGFKYLDHLIHSGKKTIFLDSDIIIDEGIGIDLDIEGIVIDGAGHTIIANGRRIFLNKTNAIIKNLTMVGAEDSAIVNDGELTLHNCTLMANKNYGGNYKECLNEEVEIVFGGAAIFNRGSINLIDCRLSDNMVYNNIDLAAAGGGAIFNLEGQIMMENCMFLYNSSIEDYLEDKYDSLHIGGAILSLKGKIEMTGCEFVRNTSMNGGAIYARNTDITASNTRFVENGIIHTFGGAIYSKFGEIRMFNSEFIENIAHCGGAIWNEEGDLTLDNPIFRDNHASEYDGEGGAIDANSCKITIYDGKFHNNIAVYGGAIYEFDCDESIRGEFYGNKSLSGGDAVYIFPYIGANNTDEERY